MSKDENQQQPQPTLNTRPRPHWCKGSTLTAAAPLLPPLPPKIKTLLRNVVGEGHQICLRLTCSNNKLYVFFKPAVSIGNVGQLTVDLVVSAISPNGRHIGYLYDSSILPVVGNDAFTQSAESLGKLNVSVEGLLHLLDIIPCSTDWNFKSSRKTQYNVQLAILPPIKN